MVKNIKIKMPIIFLLYIITLQLIGLIFSYYNNYLIIIGFIMYIGSVYIIDKRFILRFIYIIFYIITNIIGVFTIEVNSFYLTEMGYYSYPANSLGLIVIAQLVFIETMRILSSYDKNNKFCEIKDCKYIFGKIKISKMRLVKVILVAVFFMTIILFLKVINKPFFLPDVDRFIYKERYLSKLDDILTNSYLYLAPIISIYYYKTKDKRVFLLLSIIFIYLFWIGHKFGYFLDLGYMFMLPMIITISLEKIYKIIIKFTILLAILVVLVFFQSFVVWGRDFNESIEYINMRLAQQGQMWWATYGNEKAKKNNIEEIEDETKTYFNNNITKDEKLNSGIYKMMRLTTREDIFNNKVYVKNSRYAYSTQASIYYYFNSAGLIIFSIISAVGYYIVNTNLIKNMMNLKIVNILLWARLSAVFNRMLMQSDFDKLLSTQIAIILFFLLFIKIVENVDKKIK